MIVKRRRQRATCGPPMEVFLSRKAALPEGRSALLAIVNARSLAVLHSNGSGVNIIAAQSSQTRRIHSSGRSATSHHDDDVR
jgi:hypothetical protein